MGGEVKEGWRLRLFSGFLDAFQKVMAETEVSLSLSLSKRWLLCRREFLRIQEFLWYVLCPVSMRCVRSNCFRVVLEILVLDKFDFWNFLVSSI